MTYATLSRPTYRARLSHYLRMQKECFMHARLQFLITVGLASLSFGAADWPRRRGPDRDAKVTGCRVPPTWPKELKQQWDVVVGDGVATPALVGDRLYVFTRQGSNELVRCLDAATGKEIWKDTYE